MTKNLLLQVPQLCTGHCGLRHAAPASLQREPAAACGPEDHQEEAGAQGPGHDQEAG